MENTQSQIEARIAALKEKDHFSKWMGIELLETGLGSCTARMVVREEMCNGLGIAHGGISYAFADSTLAFASNGYEQPCVSFETSISHIKPLNAGDIIIAKARELSRGKHTGVYEVRVEKQNGMLAAIFKGTVFIRQQDQKS